MTPRTRHQLASPEELGKEARDWDQHINVVQGWTENPRAVPRASASTSVSLRVPTKMLSILKAFAAREGIGYQVLIKRWLDDRIREEREKVRASQVVRLTQPFAISIAASFAPERGQLLPPEAGSPLSSGSQAAVAGALGR